MLSENIFGKYVVSNEGFREKLRKLCHKMCEPDFGWLQQVPQSVDKASKQLSPLHFKSVVINQMREFNTNMRRD